MEVVLHLPVLPNVELVAAKAVETMGRALGMAQTRVEAVSVATVEACLNAMEHGGGQMTVRLHDSSEQRPARLVVEVEDQGDGFNPGESVGAKASRKQGCTTKRGWGLTLIRELMDEVQITSQPGHTLVRMWKYVDNG